MKLRGYVLLALLALGMFSGTATQVTDVQAANGYEQWTSGWSDGCYYYWDGYQYSQAACLRSDGGYDFYGPSNGQWGYAYSVGFYTNGQAWFLFQDGSWIVANPDGTIASTSFTSTTSSNGGSFIDWTDPRIVQLMDDPATAAALIQLQDSANESIDIVIDSF